MELNSYFMITPELIFMNISSRSYEILVYHLKVVGLITIFMVFTLR